MNVPIGLGALAVTAVVLPNLRKRIDHQVDYAGISLLTIGVGALVLYCSLGGATYAWGSAIEWVFLAIGLVGIGVCGGPFGSRQ